MPEQVDINDYLLGEEAEITAGDELRVRPWQPPAPTYGQGGPNTGPIFNGTKFSWGQPVTAVEGENDPEAQEISLDIAGQMRSLLMTEADYQTYQSETSQTE